VLKKQPPFLAQANIPLWLESLELLQSDKYSNFTVISGRDGTVSAAVIKNQGDFLKDLQKRLEKLSKRKQKPDMTESLVQPLVSKFKASAELQKQFSERLRYGLQQYYARHYQADEKKED
jgi:hypothetical protein